MSESRIFLGLNCFVQHSMLLMTACIFPWSSFNSTIHFCRKDILENDTSEGDLGNNSIALYLLREFQRAQVNPANTNITEMVWDIAFVKQPAPSKVHSWDWEKVPARISHIQSPHMYRARWQEKKTYGQLFPACHKRRHLTLPFQPLC